MPGALIRFVFLLSVEMPAAAQDRLFSSAAMREDFQFLRRELFHAHANPFSVWTKERYENYLDSLESGLSKPLPAAAFRQQAALALLPLGDEHAAVSLRQGASAGKGPEWADSVATNIQYRRSGRTGYILAQSFATRGSKDLPLYQRCIDSIFAQIRREGITRLVIDVSANDGGASAVGAMLINYIREKPYQSYSMNWRRSDEYLARMRSWGFHDEAYQKLAPGEVIRFPSRTVTPEKTPNPFTGKVIVVIGPGTFSSAILFATLVQDNKMAKLAGVSPENGHPSHFGEMYSVVLPNTGVELRFGVKEWIRPKGRGEVNKLLPDMPCRLPDDGDFTKLLKQLPW